MQQMLNVIAEQEVEKAQLSDLLTALKAGKVDLSWLEISQDGIKVIRPNQPVDLSEFSTADLAKALMAKQVVDNPEEPPPPSIDPDNPPDLWRDGALTEEEDAIFNKAALALIPEEELVVENINAEKPL